MCANVTVNNVLNIVKVAFPAELRARSRNALVTSTALCTATLIATYAWGLAVDTNVARCVFLAGLPLYGAVGIVALAWCNSKVLHVGFAESIVALAPWPWR